jgi:hypothetical protein
VEGSGRGLFQGLNQAFTCRDRIKRWKISQDSRVSRQRFELGTSRMQVDSVTTLADLFQYTDTREIRVYRSWNMISRRRAYGTDRCGLRCCFCRKFELSRLQIVWTGQTSQMSTHVEPPSPPFTVKICWNWISPYKEVIMTGGKSRDSLPTDFRREFQRTDMNSDEVRR